jgi:hypothetical protein
MSFAGTTSDRKRAVIFEMTTVEKNSGALQCDGFRVGILRMPAPILTHEQIHWIRTCGLTDAHMARELGIGYVTVHNARRGITFKDHPTPPDTALRKPSGRTGEIYATRSDKNCGLPALDFEAVHDIRTSGLADEVLAKKYGVSRALITRTRRGQTYTDHPTPPDLFPRSFGKITWNDKDALQKAPTIRLAVKDQVLFDRLRMRCRVDEDGCWIWTGATTGAPRPSGNHGTTSINGERESTHRAMWRAVHGDIPDGLCVCHTCDKTLCIHPYHIWLGTHSDNMRDSIFKGRHVNVRNRATKREPEHQP